MTIIIIMNTIVATLVGLTTYLILSKKNVTEERFMDGSWKEFRNYGNPVFQKYPPCYDICGATRTIFDVLESKRLVSKHKRLLEAYSMVLCQEKHMDKACVNGMLLKRINELPPTGDQNDIVDRFAPDAGDGLSREFLLRVTPVLEDAMALVLKDPALNQEQKDKISNMHNVFYSVHYPLIKGC